MTVEKYIQQLKEIEDKSTKPTWDYREFTDDSKKPYIFISPGYFLIPSFINNEVTKILNVKENFKNDCTFVSKSRNEFKTMIKLIEFYRVNLIMMSKRGWIPESYINEQEEQIINEGEW